MDDHAGEPPRPAPRPSAAGRDEPPTGPPDDDFDADAEMARWVADIEAGRERIPEPWETEGPAVSLSLGDACDLDPALLAAIAGPDGLGGQALSPAFGQGAAADALRPGPILAALTEQAVTGVSALSDDQLTGALQAARRLKNRAAWAQTVAVAEFARRRAAQFEDARARRVPAGRRPGEFPADELAIELVASGNYADMRIEHDLALTARLPQTLAGMAAGLISGHRADVIAARTASLSDADAAYADQVLAPVAPSLRIDQPDRKAAALEMKLNPEGVKARKERARRTRQRVEVRREDSGNASIAGRELDTATALASKAYIDALAVRIRNAGLTDATLPAIRARVMTELLQGRNPLNLIKPRPRTSLHTPNPGPEPASGPAEGGAGGSARSADTPRARTPAAQTIKAKDPRPMATPASPTRTTPDPNTQATLATSTATASTTRTPPAPPGTPPPTTDQLARLRALLRALNLTCEPIAHGSCDHRHAEDRYTPSRKLRDLLRARTRTCDAPGCNTQAAYCDQDHTIPYPDGPTDECNLGPKCRRHRRAKQAPGWRVERPEPGSARWTLPSGRTHTTHPTTYDA